MFELTEKNEPLFLAVIGQKTSAERARLWEYIRQAARKQELVECTPESVQDSILDGMALGLNPAQFLGEMYLFARKNTVTGKMECVMQPGYKGLIQCAARGGFQMISSLIYEGDEYEYTVEGFKTFFRVTKTDPFNTDAEKIVGSYAIAKRSETLEGEEPKVFINKSELKKAESMSRGNLWKNWPEVAKRKTAIRRLYGILDRTPEMEAILAKDIEAEDADFTVIENAPAPETGIKSFKKTPSALPESAEAVPVTIHTSPAETTQATPPAADGNMFVTTPKAKRGRKAKATTPPVETPPAPEPEQEPEAEAEPEKDIPFIYDIVNHPFKPYMTAEQSTWFERECTEAKLKLKTDDDLSSLIAKLDGAYAKWKAANPEKASELPEDGLPF